MGVLYVGRRLGKPPFGASDIHLLLMIADRVGAAFIRHALLDRSSAAIARLNDLAELASEGLVGGHRPSEGDRADIARGLSLIKAMGPFDVGQGVVVANHHVLAVEAAEGTYRMLDRLAELRRERATPVRN